MPCLAPMPSPDILGSIPGAKRTHSVNHDVLCCDSDQLGAFG